jgi:hypothetical protein
MRVVAAAIGLDLVVCILDAGLDRCSGLFRLIFHELNEVLRVLAEGKCEEGLIVRYLGTATGIGETQRVVPT